MNRVRLRFSGAVGKPEVSRGKGRLSVNGDRRFLETWRGYLNRTGDDAAIGKWRLQVLRKVAATYGIGRADETETAQVMDLLI